MTDDTPCGYFENESRRSWSIVSTLPGYLDNYPCTSTHGCVVLIPYQPAVNAMFYQHFFSPLPNILNSAGNRLCAMPAIICIYGLCAFTQTLVDRQVPVVMMTDFYVMIVKSGVHTIDTDNFVTLSAVIILAVDVLNVHDAMTSTPYCNVVSVETIFPAMMMCIGNDGYFAIRRQPNFFISCRCDWFLL